MNGRAFARILFLMTVLGVVLGVGGCANPQRPPFIYEIPAGYKGWVSVQFYRPDCPEMATEGEKIVIKIPAGGKLCTGTPLGFGDAADEYYYVDAAGTRTDAKADVLQEHVAIEGTAPKNIFERFFVGTEAELKNSPEPRSE
ncbi:MAG TPA: hypothetical protein VH394_06700 [Thermoanaerobaculia bacterium]|nr:hypothetical protein [Thermoanaerobaculia bacterium]